MMQELHVATRQINVRKTKVATDYLERFEFFWGVDILCEGGREHRGTLKTSLHVWKPCGGSNKEHSISVH